ncbi:MAG: NGG1p interacting factor NIF3 [Candidatus Anoxymicrobium japonicum]|uniref:NGG1p interacting factor NIF3 n=1 Tax=Candidatus Anoxymicrobium japonicum TaxID=2013648 RepID=A0A2N3G839_9ACTN|nr:MAG: NGG1p interacting factor NIF3 [Candidatus Anoxymicrobium japonicum]
MKLEQIYDLAVEMGISKDPRGKVEIKQLLDDASKGYERLKGDEKRFYDKERLKNPFADTRILYGDPGLDVTNVIAGIDIEGPELLLADRLREKGMKIDLCLSHHPEGTALASLSDVMRVQADVWATHGVPINVGEALIGDRMGEIRRALLPQNHQRPVDTARLLNLPFMCVHTPADNLVTDHLNRLFKKAKPRLVGDVIDLLLKEKEYRASAGRGMPPTVLVGKKKNRAGDVLVDMTGGTEGPVAAIEKLAQAGVGTIVGMHMGDKLKSEAEKQHINVVIAGHIASDNIGINLFLDQLEKRGVNARSFSGLQRFSRLKK